MQQSTGKSYFSATRIAMIALFSALSGVLYIFGFPISVAFPSWLELNFSDIPALIGTFALGPVSGSIIIVVKIFIKLMFKASHTMFVGELADLLIGLAFVIPAGLIYKKKRTFKGALLGMAVGAASSTLLAMLANWLILVPFYVMSLFGGNWEILLGMIRPLFPSITQENFYTFYILVSVLPFNLMRCLIAILITLPVYKHISKAINRLNEKLTPKNQSTEAVRKDTIITIVVVCVAIAVIVTLVLLRQLVWKG